jgi:hypothetical protein
MGEYGSASIGFAFANPGNISCMECHAKKYQKQ